jgi:uncharacterized protein (TIGR03435 family)
VQKEMAIFELTVGLDKNGCPVFPPGKSGRTGLQGKYDIDLKWSIDVAWLMERAGLPNKSNESGPRGPSLIHAVRDQLGLELISKRGTGDVVIVEHAKLHSL